MWQIPQNGRWTCPHVVNPMQNGRWTCPNVANTMQNDKFKFQNVANTRQMVPAKKSKKKSQTCSKKNPKTISHSFPCVRPRLGFELEGLHCGRERWFSWHVKRQRLSLERTMCERKKGCSHAETLSTGIGVAVTVHKFKNSCLARSLSPTFVIDASHQLSIWASPWLVLWNFFLIRSGNGSNMEEKLFLKCRFNSMFDCFRLQFRRRGCAPQVGTLVSQVGVSQVAQYAWRDQVA